MMALQVSRQTFTLFQKLTVLRRTFSRANQPCTFRNSQIINSKYFRIESSLTLRGMCSVPLKSGAG